MYTADKKGPYFGINWRAIFAYCIGAGVNFAGFLNNMGVKGFSTGVIRSFYFAFITTGCASGLSYYLLAKFFPQENYRRFKGLRFREWTEEEVELYVQSAPWRILGTAPPKVGEDGVPIMPGNRRSSEDVEDMGEKKVGTTQTTILEV